MKFLKWLVSTILILGIGIYLMLPHLNKYQVDGELTIAGLEKPVRVLRDEKRMAYLYAENMDDVIKAQGYVTAQDRLFQMQLTRILIQGRLSEFFGEKAKSSDVTQRTLGFYRAAKKHVELLNDESKHLLQNYADGVNEYIQNGQDSHHLEFKLAGIKPELWDITDTIAIIYYMGWGSAANLKTEMTSQMLIDQVGFEKYKSLFPININPDETDLVSSSLLLPDISRVENQLSLNFLKDEKLQNFGLNFQNSMQLGSNNWAMSSEKSLGGKPIVVNDPHLATQLLPTTFYPIGLFTTDFRAVGVNVPGVPSLLIGRNEFVAGGVTNAYGDAQDLYIESIDPENPQNYLEGQNSIPFQVIEENLKIKDSTHREGFRTEKFKVRLTRRGPVISNVLKGVKTQKLISVRWSPLESMQESFGLDCLLKSRSAADVRNYLKNLTAVHLNYVYADVDGNIGWQTTGRLPIRSEGNGSQPFQITSEKDNWASWIPFEQMPHSFQPQKGWVGTANHKTVTQDYPFYYSSWFAPGHRYQRMKELLDPPGQKSVSDHWNFMRDDLNVVAKRIAPIFAEALKTQNETKKLGELLNAWDFRETKESAAASIYQEVYRRLVHLTFMDELGEDAGSYFIGNTYFWQERMGLMIQEGESEWFDDQSTVRKTENLENLIQKAGLEVIADLTQRIGGNPEEWHWGKIHQIQFLNPIRRSGLGTDWLGGGTHQMAGSGDTLYRGIYPLNKPGNQVKISASMRMVVDLNDDEKVVAVIPGGVVGRTFSSDFTNQVDAYMNGEKKYWWFSDEKIQQNAVSEMLLKP